MGRAVSQVQGLGLEGANPNHLRLNNRRQADRGLPGGFYCPHPHDCLSETSAGTRSNIQNPMGMPMIVRHSR